MIPCTEGLHLKMYSYVAIHKQVAVPLHFREAVLGRNQSGCQIRPVYGGVRGWSLLQRRMGNHVRVRAGLI